MFRKWWRSAAVRPVIGVPAFCLGLGGLCGVARADLGSCSASATSINFGNLALSSLTGATGVGSISTSCPGGITTTKNWALCNSIGAGSNSASQSNRTMTNGSYSISYQLYTDAAYSNLYTYPGNTFFYTPYNSSTGINTSASVYAKILSSSLAIPPGTYTDSYTSSAQAANDNDGYPSGAVSFECTGNSNTHWWNGLSFTVSVTLLPSCSVNASNLNFGTVGVLTSATMATSTISVTCTYSTPYTVGLSAGNGVGATTTSRKMTGTSGSIQYSLFRDAARSLNWGSATGVDTVSGAGTGAAQSLTVYGLAPAQSTPAPGTYTDVIVVSVNY